MQSACVQPTYVQHINQAKLTYMLHVCNMRACCICAVGKVQAHPCIRAAYVLAAAIKHFYISQV